MAPTGDTDTAPDPNPSPGKVQYGPPEAAPPPGQNERELRFELVTIRDRLNNDSAGGYQQLPGQTRRRAALIKRERQIVAYLERRQPPLTLDVSPPDP